MLGRRHRRRRVKCAGNARDGDGRVIESYRAVVIPGRARECYRFRISLFRLNRTEMINRSVHKYTRARGAE